MLEHGDIVTLENDKEYIVASTCEYNDSFFVYFVNVDTIADCILAEVKDKDVIQVTDVELFKIIMPLILDNFDMDSLNEE